MKRKYRPTSGTEGIGFEESFCHQCIHERWVHNQETNREEDKCPIYSKMMLIEVNNPEYPIELTYDENDKPICTNWQKWDWENDGDPDDPCNPNAPDPNQLNLFPLYPDETILDKAEPMRLVYMPQQGNKTNL